MSKEVFYELPPWKQANTKKELGLFWPRPTEDSVTPDLDCNHLVTTDSDCHQVSCADCASAEPSQIVAVNFCDQAKFKNTARSKSLNFRNVGNTDLRHFEADDNPNFRHDIDNAEYRRMDDTGKADFRCFKSLNDVSKDDSDVCISGDKRDVIVCARKAGHYCFVKSIANFISLNNNKSHINHRYLDESCMNDQHRSMSPSCSCCMQ